MERSTEMITGRHRPHRPARAHHTFKKNLSINRGGRGKGGVIYEKGNRPQPELSRSKPRGLLEAGRKKTSKSWHCVLIGLALYVFCQPEIKKENPEIAQKHMRPPACFFF